MGILAVVVLGACAGGAAPGSPTAPEARREAAAALPPGLASDRLPSPPPARSVVARVDGEPVLAADAFRLVYLSAPDEAANAVRQLVVDRLSAREAAAIGATVPEEVVARELARLLAEQERRVREASKGRSDLESHVRATWGLPAAEYAAIVRESVERSLLLERVVRFELSRHARTQLRVIRVKERSLAEEIRRKLVQGADFAVLARQHSEDGSAREGGIYPPLPSDLPSPLFERTGAIAPGGISEVEEVSTADGPRYRIVQVLARLPSESGSFAELAPQIERTLDERPLAPLELEGWMRIMEDRHRIRLLGMGTDDDGS